MELTRLDEGLWLVGFCGHILLLGILIGRRRYTTFPFFTAYIAFAILITILNLIAYHHGSRTTIFWTYWGLVTVDAVLQLGVVFEMAREVLCPTGHWVHSTRKTFLTIGCGGAFLAAALSYVVNPLAANTIVAWSIRFNLFTSLLIAELVISMFLAATRVGLQWRNHVMGIAEGMALWVSISICVDTAHSYWGWTQKYLLLEHLRMFAYLVALTYWCLSFWRAEPARTTISTELHRYLYAMGDSLEYDLRKAKEARKNL